MARRAKLKNTITTPLEIPTEAPTTEAPTEDIETETLPTEEVLVLQPIVQAKEEKKQSMRVLNLRDNVLSIGIVHIPSRGEIVVSEEQMKNDDTMRRIKHAIKIGLIKEV